VKGVFVSVVAAVYGSIRRVGRISCIHLHRRSIPSCLLRRHILT
jgi:hypothetical protein